MTPMLAQEQTLRAKETWHRACFPAARGSTASRMNTQLRPRSRPASRTGSASRAWPPRGRTGLGPQWPGRDSSGHVGLRRLSSSGTVSAAGSGRGTWREDEERERGRGQGEQRGAAERGRVAAGERGLERGWIWWTGRVAEQAQGRGGGEAGQHGQAQRDAELLRGLEQAGGEPLVGRGHAGNGTGGQRHEAQPHA